MSTSLFECDKIGWIALCVIKYGEIHWVTEIVYNRIVQNVRRLLSCFCWWHLAHSILSHRVFSFENFTEVLSLVSLAIWFGIGVAGKASSIHSKIYPSPCSMAVNLKISYEYLELKKQGHELNMGELIAILLIHFILQHQENNLYNVC